jgi:alkanesulfonate monooxygenase SsuD/methylene tetrahydromethanopterin reductase-like flavin-dependent oxidoreductase (luciferase family)
MRIGVFTLQADATADPAIVAKHAEDLGFSSYWVPDHIILPVNYKTEYPGKVAGVEAPVTNKKGSRRRAIQHQPTSYPL